MSSTKSNRPKVHAVVICDDIRQEDNGKYILIGVYVGNIIFSDLPNTAILNFWMLVEAQKNRETEFEFRGLMSNEKIPMFSGKGKFTSQADLPISIPLGSTPIQFNNEGEFKLQWKPAGYRWETVRKIRIERAPI